MFILRYVVGGPARIVGRALGAAGLWALLVLGSGAQADALWNSVGPPGGTISALLASPASASTLYAGTPENGMFISLDGGATWSAANTGLQASTAIGRQSLYAVYALTTDGANIYAATASGIYYSNTAATPLWTALAPATGSATPITLLAYEPGTARLFAASGQTDGMSIPSVYATPLAGSMPTAAWTAAALPIAAGTPVGALSIVPASGTLPAALLVGVGGRLYSASILGSSPALGWVDGDPSATLLSGSVSALAYSAESGLAYACSGGAVYSSGNVLDTSALWFSVAAPASSTAFACNALVPVPTTAGGMSQVLLGTDQGAFVSSGASFAATAGLGAGISANAFALGASGASLPTPTVFMGTGSGVAGVAAAALGGGANWAPLNGPASVAGGGANQRLNNTSVADTAFVGSTLYAAAVSNQSVEVYASTDGGATWSATGVGSALAAGEAVIALAGDSTYAVLYAATTQGLLAYATGSGLWLAVASAAIPGRAGCVALGANTLFVGSDNGLFAVPRSAAPSGAVPVAAGLSGSKVRSLLVDGGNVYAGTIDSSDNNFVSTDTESAAAAGTATWGAFAGGSAGTDRITSLLRVGSNLLAATNGSLIVYASPGSSWAPVGNISDPSLPISDTFGIVYSLYSDGALIYAATATAGVFVSPATLPLSWTPINGAGSTALPALEVHTLRANAGMVLAATRGGVSITAGPSAGSTVPPPTTPPASAPASAASSVAGGGGAFDPFLAPFLLCAVAALWPARRR